MRIIVVLALTTVMGCGNRSHRGGVAVLKSDKVSSDVSSSGLVNLTPRQTENGFEKRVELEPIPSPAISSSVVAPKSVDVVKTGRTKIASEQSLEGVRPKIASEQSLEDVREVRAEKTPLSSSSILVASETVDGGMKRSSHKNEIIKDATLGVIENRRKSDIAEADSTNLGYFVAAESSEDGKQSTEDSADTVGDSNHPEDSILESCVDSDEDGILVEIVRPTEVGTDVLRMMAALLPEIQLRKQPETTTDSADPVADGPAVIPPKALASTEIRAAKTLESDNGKLIDVHGETEQQSTKVVENTGLNVALSEEIIKDISNAVNESRQDDLFEETVSHRPKQEADIPVINAVEELGTPQRNHLGTTENSLPQTTLGLRSDCEIYSPLTEVQKGLGHEEAGQRSDVLSDSGDLDDAHPETWKDNFGNDSIDQVSFEAEVGSISTPPANAGKSQNISTTAVSTDSSSNQLDSAQVNSALSVPQSDTTPQKQQQKSQGCFVS